MLLKSMTDPVVRALMPGKVIEVLVEEGQIVERGQAVVRVEAELLAIAHAYQQATDYHLARPRIEATEKAT